jgi:uncharacterized damage-inducible protein DinB
MNTTEITTLIRFNFWANDCILAACERLTSDAFTRDLAPDPGWGSLRGVLVHILDTEYGWRSVLQGQDANMILESADFPDVAALKTRWDSERAAWFDYASSLTDERINQRYDDDPQTGLTVWQTIMHVITHGIQHRSEAAFILTGYGQSPGELDFDVFLQENPGYIRG